MTDRGVSITVSHVLAVGITALLISGLLMAGSEFLANERERAIDDTLRTEGSRLASELTTVDRAIVDAKAQGSAPNVSLLVHHPESVSGTSYLISLSKDGDCLGDGNASISCLEIRADTSRVSVKRTIPWRNSTSVRESSVSGGPILIRANNSTIWLESGEP